MLTDLHRRKAAVLVRRRHSHGRVDRWRRGRAVRSTGRTGVVLRAAPAQTNTRVADWVALHLIDGHFSSVSLHELNEAAALSRWNLDVGDLAEALEERAKLILGDVARQTTDEDRRVVGISELVHRLGSSVVSHWGTTHGRRVHGTRHTHRGVSDSMVLVLRSRGGDAHGTVATVDTLHLSESTLLVVLIGEAHETVAARHATNRVGHDLGGLARREAALEKRDQDVFVDLGAEVADENRIFGATVIPAYVYRSQYHLQDHEGKD